MSCSVTGCVNTRRFKPEGISFHTFPKDDLVKSWLNFLGKDFKTWIWTKNKVICSKHFNENDFIIKGGNKVLKINVVPRIERSQSLSESQSSANKDLSQNISSSRISTGPNLSLEGLAFKRMLSELEKNVRVHETSTTSTDSIENRRAFFKIIHSYSTSPQKMKMKNVQLRKRQAQYRKKLFTAKKEITALQKEITTLTTVVRELKQQLDMKTENVHK